MAAWGCHLVAGCLLAADRGGWRCFATVIAVWDCVRGRRLRHRLCGTIKLAADYGGLLSMAGATWCGSTSEDDASEFLVLLLWLQWLDAWVDEVELWCWFGC